MIDNNVIIIIQLMSIQQQQQNTNNFSTLLTLSSTSSKQNLITQNRNYKDMIKIEKLYKRIQKTYELHHEPKKQIINALQQLREINQVLKNVIVEGQSNISSINIKNSGVLTKLSKYKQTHAIDTINRIRLRNQGYKKCIMKMNQQITDIKRQLQQISCIGFKANTISQNNTFIQIKSIDNKCSFANIQPQNTNNQENKRKKQSNIYALQEDQIQKLIQQNKKLRIEFDKKVIFQNKKQIQTKPSIKHSQSISINRKIEYPSKSNLKNPQTHQNTTQILNGFNKSYNRQKSSVHTQNISRIYPNHFKSPTYQQSNSYLSPIKKTSHHLDHITINSDLSRISDLTQRQLEKKPFFNQIRLSLSNHTLNQPPYKSKSKSKSKSRSKKGIYVSLSPKNTNQS